MWRGSLVSVFIAPAGGAAMHEVREARAVPARGLEGDRYFNASGTYSDKPARWGGRDVTLFEQEVIEALARGERRRDDERIITLRPEATRRNLLTRDVPLNHLVDRDFWVGEVKLRGVRLCEPCALLEEQTEKGMLAALLHRGGLRAEILQPGTIRAGDEIRPASS